MKKAFLLFVLPALLVALGVAQTPAASSDTDQTTIKGCLGGSDGNFTVVEDNTGHIFKITSSTADLKPHLNHDITLVGHKTSGASSTPADNSLAITEVKMISEHCAAAAAASTAPVTTPSETATTPAAPPAAAAPAATVSALPETIGTPPTDATAPAPAATATPPAATATTPAADATPPALIVTAPAETTVTPAAAAAVPVATIKTPAKTASTPAARPRKQSETAAAATATPAVIASTPAASAVIPVATDSPSKEPVSTPAAVAPAPAPTPASSGWSLWLLIAAGVLVLVLGVMYPFVSRWRKQQNLERTDAPNLSFNREASSAQNKSDQGASDRKGPRKAA
jgi:hypothetical protein